jgi:hypothetical protein
MPILFSRIQTRCPLNECGQHSAENRNWNWHKAKVLGASFHGIWRKHAIMLAFGFIERNKIKHKFHVTKSLHGYVEIR